MPSKRIKGNGHKLDHIWTWGKNSLLWVWQSTLLREVTVSFSGDIQNRGDGLNDLQPLQFCDSLTLSDQKQFACRAEKQLQNLTACLVQPDHSPRLGPPSKACGAAQRFTCAKHAGDFCSLKHSLLSYASSVCKNITVFFTQGLQISLGEIGECKQHHINNHSLLAPKSWMQCFWKGIND